MHQIIEAKSAGYDKGDIVNSVIRAMVPSFTLRNVLKTTHNLTLKKLMQFLETHFDERNTTVLCSNLIYLNQLPKNGSTFFCDKIH